MPRVIETSSFRRETDIRHTEEIKRNKVLQTSKHQADQKQQPDGDYYKNKH